MVRAIPGHSDDHDLLDQANDDALVATGRPCWVVHRGGAAAGVQETGGTMRTARRVTHNAARPTTG
jgi:hypothetical protein